MALAGNCMAKADTCPNCGKAMGFLAGFRGLGLRQKGHMDRCMRRSKAASKSAYAVDTEAVVPYSPPAENNETPWYHKPSVGTWSLRSNMIGAHAKHSATDGPAGQLPPGIDASEPRSAAKEEPSSSRVVYGLESPATVSEVVDTSLAAQVLSDTPIVEKELITLNQFHVAKAKLTEARGLFAAMREESSPAESEKGAPACHYASLPNDVCESESSVAASGVAQQEFGEQQCFEKVVHDPTQTQVASECSTSTAQEILPLEALEECLVCQKAQQASQAEPTAAASHVV